MRQYPILILHGWNLSSVDFVPLKSAFERKNFKVHSPDLPGFGKRNILIRTYTLDDYVDFVKEYLNKNNILEVILVGHSFGGRIALRYAELYSNSVKSLILTGVPGYSPVSPVKKWTFLILSKVGNAFFLIPPLFIAKPFVTKLFQKSAKAGDYSKTSGFIRGTFKNIIAFDLISSMKKILVPTLLIWGKNDGIVPVSIAQRMNSTIPKSKLRIIRGANHKIPYTHSTLFVATALSFIKSP